MAELAYALGLTARDKPQRHNGRYGFESHRQEENLKEEKTITMKTGYKFILALLVCFACGCPRSSAVDAGTDLGSDVPAGAETSVDGSVDQ